MMGREVEQRLGKETTQNCSNPWEALDFTTIVELEAGHHPCEFKGSERHQDHQVSSHSTTAFIFRKPAAHLFGRCCWTCVSVLHSDCIQSSALPMFV
jgi:hypothetical protein